MLLAPRRPETPAGRVEELFDLLDAHGKPFGRALDGITAVVGLHSDLQPSRRCAERVVVHHPVRPAHHRIRRVGFGNRDRNERQRRRPYRHHANAVLRPQRIAQFGQVRQRCLQHRVTNAGDERLGVVNRHPDRVVVIRLARHGPARSARCVAYRLPWRRRR